MSCSPAPLGVSLDTAQLDWDPLRRALPSPRTTDGNKSHSKSFPVSWEKGISCSPFSLCPWPAMFYYRNVPVRLGQ